MCKVVLEDKYTSEGNSYLAGEKILKILSENLQTIEIKSGKTTTKFLIHGKRALYTRIIAYHRKQQIKLNKFDTAKNCTTIKGSKNQLSAFFTYNNGQFKDYTLVVNIGNLQHDMAMFIKNENGNYSFIHYDPNIKTTSQITTAFVKQFGTNSRRYGYNSKDGNINGNCTKAAWTEILKFMLKEEDFLSTIQLQQYCSVTHTYLTREEIIEVTNKEKKRSNIYEKTTRKQYRNSNTFNAPEIDNNKNSI